jgi:hypothetical protein
MTVLAQSKKNFIKRHNNSTTLVFLWDKTTPTLYKIHLMHLEEAIIINTNGTDHEIAIFQVILDWVVNLKKG